MQIMKERDAGHTECFVAAHLPMSAGLLLALQSLVSHQAVGSLKLGRDRAQQASLVQGSDRTRR